MNPLSPVPTRRSPGAGRTPSVRGCVLVRHDGVVAAADAGAAAASSSDYMVYMVAEDKRFPLLIRVLIRGGSMGEERVREFWVWLR